MASTFWVFLLLLCGTYLPAQTDLKLNVGSALTGGINAAAEVPVGGQSGFSIGAAYSSLSPIFDYTEDFSYRNARLIPEYRYYFAPRDGQDRFFVGGYGKVGYLTGVDKSTDEKAGTFRTALGILTGHKWIAPSGFLFELNAGLGRAVSFGGDPDNLVYQRVIDTVTNVDLRLGILLGWRVGRGSL